MRWYEQYLVVAHIVLTSNQNNP